MLVLDKIYKFSSCNCSRLQYVSSPSFSQRSVQVVIKRDDLIHPTFGGNKWRKLKYNLIEAVEQGAETLLTFGGAYSNHLYATAAAAHYFGFRSVGVVRGECIAPLNPTLEFASDQGMQLVFCKRSDYRNPQQLLFQAPDWEAPSYVIPEGGANAAGFRGCVELARELIEHLNKDQPTYILTACGTGTTLAGLIAGMKGQASLIGISVLRGNFMEAAVRQILQQNKQKDHANWQIISDYHFGGYGKWTPELLSFIQSFGEQTGIPLDPIYTGKLAFAVADLIAKGFFPAGSKVIFIHSGGLQGIVGFNQRFDQHLPLLYD